MNIVVLLPMKGNSERVPNKNLKLFNGKPLFHAVIDELNKSKYINKVIINTDSDLIANSAINTFKSLVMRSTRAIQSLTTIMSSAEDVMYDNKIPQIQIPTTVNTASPSILLSYNSLNTDKKSI